MPISPNNGQAATAPEPFLTLKPRPGWAALNLREIWLFREVMFTLAARDLKLRYKQTALGAAWVVLQPLLAAGIFAFVFGTVAGMDSDGQPYFLFSFAGLIGWKLFQGMVTQSTLCIVENSDLVSKVYFPRLALSLSTIPSNLVDFGVSLVLMAVLMLAYRIELTWALLLLPVWTLVMLLLAAGLGVILSALAVYYRDVKHVLPVFVQMLLYISPVAYAVSEVPDNYRSLFYLNPLVAPLEAFRWSLLGTSPPQAEFLAYSVILAFGGVIVAGLIFKRLERGFVDAI